MTTIFSPGIDQNALASSIQEITESTSLLSLATVMDHGLNAPWINTAYYAQDDDYCLFFLSDPDAQHSKNVAKNATCSVAIFNSQQSGEGGKAGLQITGKCTKVSGIKLATGLLAYQKRFSGFDKVIGNTEDFDKNIIKAKLYCIEISEIKIFDEAAFGAEVWIQAEVLRK